MAQKTKVAAVQMTSTEDVERNLKIATELTNAAIDEGAQLVVLPECFAVLGPEDAKLKIRMSGDLGRRSFALWTTGARPMELKSRAACGSSTTGRVANIERDWHRPCTRSAMFTAWPK